MSKSPSKSVSMFLMFPSNQVWRRPTNQWVLEKVTWSVIVHLSSGWETPSVAPNLSLFTRKYGYPWLLIAPTIVEILNAPKCEGWLLRETEVIAMMGRELRCLMRHSRQEMNIWNKNMMSLVTNGYISDWLLMGVPYICTVCLYIYIHTSTGSHLSETSKRSANCVSCTGAAMHHCLTDHIILPYRYVWK